MQQLIIFIGEQDSQKDQLFQLLPKEFKEIVFEKLLIKEKIDQGDKKLTFINFPESNEITQAIPSLLTLSEFFQITQFVICLHYAQSYIQKVQYIQKQFNEAFNSQIDNIFTFFMSNSPNQNHQKNRIYQFSKIDVYNQNTYISILKDIYTQQISFNSYIHQSNLQNTIKQYQEQLQQRVNNFNKQFEEEYLLNSSCYLENKFQELLSNEFQLLNKSNIEILDQNIKQNEITVYSDAIYELCCKRQGQISSFNQFHEYFNKMLYCANCNILYQKQENKFITYELSFFTLDQKEIDSDVKFKCYKCQQIQLTQLKQKIILFFSQLYTFKQIQNYLKKQQQCLAEAPKKLYQERILNIKNKKDYTSILLLSDEDELKQFIMSKVYEMKNYKEKNQFQEGEILNDSFYLIDSPIFQFDEDSEELEQIYSNYLNTNSINFIIFCLKVQRSSLIKQRLLSMLKKLPNINKQAFGAFIINQNDEVVKESDEKEIVYSTNGTIPQTTLIQNNTTNQEIVNKISDFIKNVNQSQKISFETTIFHQRGNESNQEQIEKSLLLMSQNITDQYTQNCQQEIKEEEIKQQNLEFQKQKLIEQIVNLQYQFNEEKKDLTNLMQQIQQELREKEQNYRENLRNLKNQIFQTEQDFNYSIFNSQQKKSQLEQIEIEKMRKSFNLNQSYKTRHQ